MNRLWGVVLGAALLAVASCTIERTPAEYLDPPDPVVVERRAASEELRDRVLAMGQQLGRGDVPDALAALNPAPGAFWVGLVDGASSAGDGQVAAALQQFVSGPVALQVRDVRVTIGSQGRIAWVAAFFDAAGSDRPEPSVLRLTGVYAEEGGEWQLVQAHLSVASPPLNSLPRYPSATDSVAAE